MTFQRKLSILYEDSHVLAINKPPRVASVPAKNIPLYETALGKAQREFEPKGIKPYVLHRLDYETSGVLLFGKFPRDREALEGIWKHPDTKKKYVALVKGAPRGNKIKLPLASRTSGEKIPAETDFRILKVFPGKPFPLALVEAEIKTGRKHQIRWHFAKIGCPVLLDAKYGDQKLNRAFRLNFRLGRLFLHASSIEFFHPFLKKSVKFEAPLPPDLQSVLKKLSFGG